MENTKIEWASMTFNPWMGCTKVSAACKNCYAERDMDKRLNAVVWGDKGTRVVTSDAYWRKPLSWNRKAGEARPRVFCASLADVFEDWQGPMKDHNGNLLYDDEGMDVGMHQIRKRLFDLIDQTPNLDWLLLTKRPENILKFWPQVVGRPYVPEAGSMNEYQLLRRENVWLGVSVEDQEQADKRIPELLRHGALCPVLFLSCEPLLGPVNLERVAVPPLHDALRLRHHIEGSQFNCLQDDEGCFHQSNHHVNWVIAGGESGPGARPSHPGWFEFLQRQCAAASVPFFFKQWGEWSARIPGDQMLNGSSIELQENQVLISSGSSIGGRLLMTRWGKSKTGRLLGGREFSEVPS